MRTTTIAHARTAAILAALCIVAGWPQPAGAQKFPAKPIRIVIGFQPGGGSDTAARPLAQKLTEALGEPVIIENRPGASGNIAAALVAKSPPDGYTIFMANSTIAIPTMYPKLSFDVSKDFLPLSLIAIGPSVLMVHPSLPVRSVPQLIALAKASPGQVTYASGGLGNTTHLAMELLASMAGMKMAHVPYKGGAPAVLALISGEVSAGFASIPSGLPQIKAGRVRALGVSIARRSSALPDVPTIEEAGLRGYYAASWYGMLLPANTPRDVVGVLSREIVGQMRSPDMRDKLAVQGFEPVGSSPEEFSKFIREEMLRWERVIRSAGIKPE